MTEGNQQLERSSNGNYIWLPFKILCESDLHHRPIYMKMIKYQPRKLLSNITYKR